MEEQTQGFWKGFSWKRSVITVFLILLTAGAVGGTVWYVMDRNAKDTKDANDKSLQAMEDRIDLMSKVTEKTTTTEAKSTEPTLTSLDANYYLYTNPKMGFSMKVVKKAISNACNYVTSEKSYRPKNTLVAVKVLDDSNTIYITPETTTSLSSATTNGGITKYGACNLVTATLANINTNYSDNGIGFYFPHWRIRTFDASTDAEVTAFLKSHYGSGCSMGEKKATSQTGTYQIGIKGDGLDLGTTKCPVNFRSAIFYNQEKGKIIYWDMGQASVFYRDDTHQYDDVMVNSFKFL